MATTQKGARTRQLIIRVAADCFALNGYAGVGLTDVAERAGVTKGAFYFHFPSKESLAHAVCSSYHAQLEELRDRLGVEEPNPMQRIVRLIVEVADSYRLDPLARGTTRLLEESNRLEQPLRPLNPTWIQWLQSTLDEAARTGTLRDGVDTLALAQFMNASFYGIQVLSYTRTGWRDLPLRIRDMFHYLLPGVLADPEQIAALTGATSALLDLTERADDGSRADAGVAPPGQLRQLPTSGLPA